MMFTIFGSSLSCTGFASFCFGAEHEKRKKNGKRKPVKVAADFIMVLIKICVQFIFQKIQAPLLFYLKEIGSWCQLKNDLISVILNNFDIFIFRKFLMVFP